MIIGVLGGMGPSAAAEFLSLAYRNLEGVPDSLFNTVILDNSVQTPSRTLAYMGSGTSPIPSLCDRVKSLMNQGADYIFAPCNSVHYWRDAVIAGTGAKWISIIDTVSSRIQQEGVKRIVVLGARIVYSEKLYSGAGATAIYPTPDLQNELETLILNYKNTGYASHLSAGLREFLQSQDSPVLLACTELVFFREIFGLVPKIYDTNKIYSEALASYIHTTPSI